MHIYLLFIIGQQIRKQLSLKNSLLYSQVPRGGLLHSLVDGTPPPPTSHPWKVPKSRGWGGVTFHCGFIEGKGSRVSRFSMGYLNNFNSGAWELSLAGWPLGLGWFGQESSLEGENYWGRCLGVGALDCLLAHESPSLEINQPMEGQTLGVCWAPRYQSTRNKEEKIWPIPVCKDLRKHSVKYSFHRWEIWGQVREITWLGLPCPMGGNQGDLPEIEQAGPSAKFLFFTLFRNNLWAPKLRDRGPRSSGLNTVTLSIANLTLCIPGLQRDSKCLFCCFSCLLPPFSLPAWKLPTLSSWEIFSVSLKIEPRAYLL